jgi:release factor glutamine methyltransferase
LLTIKQNFSRDKKSSFSVLDFLKQFLKENCSDLQLLYPGIKEKFFIEEFLFFSKVSTQTSIWDHSFSQNWAQFLTLLEKGTPIEYINQRAFFFESFFYVDKRVLIPRFETEVLLEHCLMELGHLSRRRDSALSLCEVGVGPGTVGLSLLKNFSKSPVELLGIDISEDALDVARINHFRLATSFSKNHSVQFKLGDRFNGISGQFDLIISNPPYIKKDADKELVHKMVLEHEPEVALFLEDEEYEQWFQSFFAQAYERLTNGGLLLMEGHESHLVHLGSLCKNVFGNPAEIIKDLSGAARLLKVRKQDG